MQLERKEVIDCRGVEDRAFRIPSNGERCRPYAKEKAGTVAKLNTVANQIAHIKTRRVLAGDQLKADQTVPVKAPAHFLKRAVVDLLLRPIELHPMDPFAVVFTLPPFGRDRSASKLVPDRESRLLPGKRNPRLVRTAAQERINGRDLVLRLLGKRKLPKKGS